jgi:hypothetical protein
MNIPASFPGFPHRPFVFNNIPVSFGRFCSADLQVGTHILDFIPVLTPPSGVSATTCARRDGPQRPFVFNNIPGSFGKFCSADLQVGTHILDFVQVLT